MVGFVIAASSLESPFTNAGLGKVVQAPGIDISGCRDRKAVAFARMHTYDAFLQRTRLRGCLVPMSFENTTSELTVFTTTPRIRTAGFAGGQTLYYHHMSRKRFW